MKNTKKYLQTLMMKYKILFPMTNDEHLHLQVILSKYCTDHPADPVGQELMDRAFNVKTL